MRRGMRAGEEVVPPLDEELVVGDEHPSAVDHPALARQQWLLGTEVLVAGVEEGSIEAGPGAAADVVVVDAEEPVG